MFWDLFPLSYICLGLAARRLYSRLRVNYTLQLSIHSYIYYSLGYLGYWNADGICILLCTR